MAGAGLAAALILFNVPARWQLVGFAAAVLVASKLSAPYLTVAHAQQSGASHREEEPPHFVWPHGLLLVLALLLFAGMGAEGVMYDWSVLYLKQELGLPQDLAALGYAVFAAAMAVARFGGDWVRARYDEAFILKAGATLTAVSMVLVLWSAVPWVAFVGFALVGVGIAQVAPILYNAASRVPGQSPAAAIAAVTSIGYGGFLFWPPVVGSLAQHFSLVAALMVVSLSATVLALGAQWVGPRLPKPDQDSAA
jgi:fucose permease